MKMVNLKRADGDEAMAACPIEQYGYGLRIYLDQEQCEALGITSAPKPGTQVKLQAVGIITQSSSNVDMDNDSPSGTEVSLSIQITDMGLETGTVMRNAAQVLYGGEQ